MKVFIENVDELPNEEYAMARKNTFGASDVATLYGLGFKTLDEMLATKALPYLTEEELAIGDLPSVRKGRDLEPLILQKYCEEYDKRIYKPKHMFEIMEGLTVNFDGINFDTSVPVEFKYVTTFGHKNYKTQEKEYEIDMSDKQHGDMKSHIQIMAAQLGIPAYYYTQLQTQILGAETDYGVLVALFEKDWTIREYKCPKDPFFQKDIPVTVKREFTKLAVLKGLKQTPADTEDFTY